MREYFQICINTHLVFFGVFTAAGWYLYDWHNTKYSANVHDNSALNLPVQKCDSWMCCVAPTQAYGAVMRYFEHVLRVAVSHCKHQTEVETHSCSNQDCAGQRSDAHP